MALKLFAGKVSLWEMVPVAFLPLENRRKTDAASGGTTDLSSEEC